MNENGYTEVYFGTYCKTCKHYEKNSDDQPCYACLHEPMNLHSHRPVKWEEKGK